MTDIPLVNKLGIKPISVRCEAARVGEYHTHARTQG